MKILIPNERCFEVLEDLVPDPTITIDRIFFKYVVDTENRYVTQDNFRITTTLNENISRLYNLLKLYCKDDVNNIWFLLYSKYYKRKLSSYTELMLKFFGFNQIENYYTLSRKGTANILNTIYAKYYDKWERLITGYNSLTGDEALNPYNIDKNIKTIKDIMKNSTDIGTITKNIMDYGKKIVEDNETIYGKKVVDENIVSSQDQIQPFNATDKADTNNNTTNDINTETNSGKDSIKNTFNNSGRDTNNIDKNTKTKYERSNQFEQEIKFKGNLGNVDKISLMRKGRELLNELILDTVIDDINNLICRNSYGRY